MPNYQVFSTLDETSASMLYARKCKRVYDLRSADGGSFSIQESVLKSLSHWFISYQQSPVIDNNWSAVASWIEQNKPDQSVALIVSPVQYAAMQMAERKVSKAIELLTHKQSQGGAALARADNVGGVPV